MSKLEDAVRNGEKIVLDETSNSSNWRAAEAKLKADRENAQLQSAEDLRKLLQMMEADQKEQALESKKTKLISICGLIISGVTLAATIIFGLLQVLH